MPIETELNTGFFSRQGININLLTENGDQYVTDISIDINPLRESHEKHVQPDLSISLSTKTG